MSALSRSKSIAVAAANPFTATVKSTIQTTTMHPTPSQPPTQHAGSIRPKSKSKGPAQSESAPRPYGIETDFFTEHYDVSVAESGPYADHVLVITYTNDPQSATIFQYEFLRTCTSLGFDLEHKPTFRPGQKPNVSLLQFAPVPDDATRRRHPVLVYSIYHDNGTIPDPLLEILRHPRIVKFGVGISQDIRHLSFLGFTQESRATFKELAKLAFERRLVERSTVGLKRLVEVVMGEEATRYKSKQLQMTNWELRALTVQQLKYAAMDAFTAAECYRRIAIGDVATPVVFVGGVTIGIEQ